MKEDLLHYVWRLQRFDHAHLRTTLGESIDIIDRGTLNPDAGPDFLNAKLRIGDTLWAGNVEMHLASSDWTKHQHQHDRAYDNVILHVVLDEDMPIYHATGERIPCLEMRRRIAPKLYNTYLRLLDNEHWIPCQYHFYKATELTKNLFLDRLLVERLERKREDILRLLERNNYDWENSFFQFLARYLGGRINADAAERLARELDIKLFAKHGDQAYGIESLLFGQSGLLPEQSDEPYVARLIREYDFLRKKYNLIPADRSTWKFLRMRPAGFPTIRIAQLAALVRKQPRPVSTLLEFEALHDFRDLFQIELPEYWTTHYRFDRTSQERSKQLGRTTIDSLLINVVVPFLFLYDELRGNDRGEHRRSLRLLEQMPAENNKIIRGWRALGMEVDNAYRSQSLLQLKRAYCDRHRCLECSIGNAILQASPSILREPEISWPNPERPQNEPTPYSN